MDEVFISREDHDQYEICRQRYVDEVEHVDDQIVPAQSLNFAGSLVEVSEEAINQENDTADEADQKRRHQPAGKQERRLKAAFDLPHQPSLLRHSGFDREAESAERRERA